MVGWAFQKLFSPNRHLFHLSCFSFSASSCILYFCILSRLPIRYAWVATAVDDFSLAGIGGLPMLAVVKTEWLEHPKPNVKAAAMAVLVAVFKQVSTRGQTQ